MIVNKRLFHLTLILFFAFILGLGGSIQPKTAFAATQDSGYQISITESAPTMIYGEPSPSFQAQLTVPANDPLTNPANFYIMVDTQGYGGDISGIVPTYSLYVGGIDATPTLSVGQHSVVAVYYSLLQMKMIESAPITLTVLKATPALTCYINNLAYTYAPNTPLTITMEFSNINAPFDWQNATYTIKFVGTHTFTWANLKSDSSTNQVTVSTPRVTGSYQLQCIFNGSNSFNSAGFDLGALVSYNYKPSFKLYTNPTALKAGQPFTWRVVASGRKGLPAPTGNIDISIGTSYSLSATLGPDGKVTIRGKAPSFLSGNTIEIFYFGNSVYTSYIANFPLKNPPIGS
jgi:hypothetical protein